VGKTGREYCMHVETEAIAQQLLLYGRRHHKPSSVVDQPQSHSVKRESRYAIDLWADRWQAVCASAPPTSRRFHWTSGHGGFRSSNRFLTCPPSATDGGKKGLKYVRRAQGSGVSVGVLDQVKKLWSVRTSGKQKLSLEMVSAKRPSLEFHEFQD
jgi:hypothetical protein